MTEHAHILSHLLEADEEDFGLKDVSDPFLTPAGPATVTRHGRWKVVDMAGYTFLISFLTPVAYLDKGTGTYYRTRKHWSPTTEDHISYWQRAIAKSPEYTANPDNWEDSQYTPGQRYIKYPRFQRKRQDDITGLFRKLMMTMQMKPHHKRRLYHVDPNMRSGSEGQRRAHQWVSGHLKHKDTKDQGLPRKHWSEPGYAEFFSDFDPDDPEFWDWQQSERRSQEPHEPEQ